MTNPEQRRLCYERAILCPTNIACNKINDEILKNFSGQPITSVSVDWIVDKENAHEIPMENLNASTPPGFPPHILTLKKGVPIVLLRSISLTDGLVNGTRMIV